MECFSNAATSEKVARRWGRMGRTFQRTRCSHRRTSVRFVLRRAISSGAGWKGIWEHINDRERQLRSAVPLANGHVFVQLNSMRSNRDHRFSRVFVFVVVGSAGPFVANGLK